MKVLNLYAGIGGNRALWGDEVKVTAVELNPEIAEEYQKNFPGDTVIVADAHKYLLEHLKDGWDFIWSSPPCQTHSKMNKATKHDILRYPDMKLYQEILLLQGFFNGAWVVENVKPYYDPLLKPQTCARHLFWANFHITDIKKDTPPNFINADKEAMQGWLGIQCRKNIYLDGNHDPAQVLRNCVHPHVGKHIMRCAFKETQEVLL